VPDMFVHRRHAGRVGSVMILSLVLCLADVVLSLQRGRIFALTPILLSLGTLYWMIASIPNSVQYLSELPPLPRTCIAGVGALPWAMSITHARSLLKADSYGAPCNAVDLWSMPFLVVPLLVLWLLGVCGRVTIWTATRAALVLLGIVHGLRPTIVHGLRPTIEVSGHDWPPRCTDGGWLDDRFAVAFVSLAGLSTPWLRNKARSVWFSVGLNQLSLEQRKLIVRTEEQTPTAVETAMQSQIITGPENALSPMSESEVSALSEAPSQTYAHSVATESAASTFRHEDDWAHLPLNTLEHVQSVRRRTMY